MVVFVLKMVDKVDSRHSSSLPSSGSYVHHFLLRPPCPPPFARHVHHVHQIFTYGKSPFLHAVFPVDKMDNTRTPTFQGPQTPSDVHLSTMSTNFCGHIRITKLTDAKGALLLYTTDRQSFFIAIQQESLKKKVAIFPAYLYNIGIISTREGIV